MEDKRLWELYSTPPQGWGRDWEPGQRTVKLFCRFHAEGLTYEEIKKRRAEIEQTKGSDAKDAHAKKYGRKKYREKRKKRLSSLYHRKKYVKTSGGITEPIIEDDWKHDIDYTLDFEVVIKNAILAVKHEYRLPFADVFVAIQQGMEKQAAFQKFWKASPRTFSSQCQRFKEVVDAYIKS